MLPYLQYVKLKWILTIFYMNENSYLHKFLSRQVSVSSGKIFVVSYIYIYI